MMKLYNQQFKILNHFLLNPIAVVVDVVFSRPVETYIKQYIIISIIFKNIQCYFLTQ